MNKYISRIAGKDKFDEALASLKGMVDEAKKDPEKAKSLGQALAKSRTAGTTAQKAWD